MKQRIKIDKAIPNSGALDFSWLLDAPAGKHGFIEVRDGHMYYADGTRAKFVGFNMPTRSNTPDHETADKLAKRFATLGINVVRLHAADAPVGLSGWSSSMDNPLIDYSSGSSRSFNEKGLDRFDYFYAKLREKGIYLHMDLLVARAFMEGDNLDYPGNPPASLKSFTHINRRLIELQKEYAKMLLCHVNPYTGLAIIDDPAVMTIEINNEDSVLKGTDYLKDIPDVIPYRQELQRRFNCFLLAKYDNRINLAKAWSFQGVCALEDDEDPECGTVVFPEGSHVQVVNNPMGEWTGINSPARYADFMEFAIHANRNYYEEMIDYVRSLGAKVPVATSNLLGGAADVYSHASGDIMQNNSYFNHPVPPFHESLKVAAMQEYVSMNPLTMQENGVFLRTSLLSMASYGVIDKKPFVLSEWNEYGAHPFHSTAFISTAAYACLNDWDGLIVYCYHTSENWNDQPADEILDVFDAYNDPALICQFGFMSAIFLQGLVKPARNQFDLVFTQNDLKTLPPAFAMPNSYLPYVGKFRNVFLDTGEAYTGAADVAVTAGYLNVGDLSQAKRSVYYSWSPYRDAYRHTEGGGRLERIAEKTDENLSAAKLGENILLFENIASISAGGNYIEFAKNIDEAFKSWGILNENQGLVNNALVSDTEEIYFDPQAVVFQVNTDECCYFSGNPENSIAFGDCLSMSLSNERISAALLPLDGKGVNTSSRLLLTLIGHTGMDETLFTDEGFLTSIELKGKLYADTAEGTLHINGESVTLTALDTTGNTVSEIRGAQEGADTVFTLDGSISSVHYLIEKK